MADLLICRGSNGWLRNLEFLLLRMHVKHFFYPTPVAILAHSQMLIAFPLGVTKLVSTGQGGFVVTKNRDVYERLKFIRNHGFTNEFTESYDQFGFNFQFTDLLASFGLVQLSRVSKRIVHLNKIYAKYESAISKFKCVNLLPVNVLSGEILLYAEVLCPERKELENFLHFRLHPRPHFRPHPHLQID